MNAMTASRKPVALVTGANKGIGFEVAGAIRGNIRVQPRIALPPNHLQQGLGITRTM